MEFCVIHLKNEGGENYCFHQFNELQEWIVYPRGSCWGVLFKAEFQRLFAYLLTSEELKEYYHCDVTMAKSVTHSPLQKKAQDIRF